MPPLSRALRAYIAAVAIVAAATAAFVSVSFREPLGAREAWFAPFLLTGFIVGVLFPLRLAPQHNQELSPSAGIIAVLLLPAPFAIAICSLGQFIGEVRRPAGRAAQCILNTSLVALQAATAAAAVVGLEAIGFKRESAWALALTGFAIVTWFAVGAALLEGAVAIQARRRPGRRWWERQRVAARVEWGLLGVGACAALVADIRPWVLPLLVVPVIELYRALANQQLTLRAARAEREHAEQARRYLGALIDATPDIVFTLDATSRITYANPAARSLLRLPEAAKLPECAIDAVFPDWKRTANMAAFGGSWSGESSLVTPHGRIPVSQVILVHRSPRGGVEFISTIARDISERKDFEEQLRFLADHDVLTGVFNRRRFQAEVDDSLELCRRAGRGGAFLYIDLDGFKEVNDSYGHAVGDRLLQQIAGGLAGLVEPGEGTLGRLGGDEFGLFVTGLDQRTAAAFAGRVLDVIRSSSIEVDGQTIALSGSVGVAAFGARNVRREHLMAMADAAMYEAKESGSGFHVATDTGARLSA